MFGSDVRIGKMIRELDTSSVYSCRESPGFANDVWHEFATVNSARSYTSMNTNLEDNLPSALPNGET